jgi:hypothetical protein
MDQALEYVQDGAPLSNRNFGGERNSPQGQLPDPDAVQELKMDISNANAEFAAPANGIITTKSGTNQIHGTAFETARNAAFGLAKQRGFVTTPTADADPPLVRNEFGASAGGPIVLPHLYNGRDKSFWFFAYERYTLRSWTPLLTTVPTTAMKNGDFSNLLALSTPIQLYDFATTHSATNCNNTGKPNTYCRTPFANNQIPVGRRSPVAKIVYDILPDPTTADNPAQTTNFQMHNLNNFTVPTVTFRLDHSFNESNHAYLRYTDDLEDWVTLRNSSGNAPLTVAADGIPAGASGGTQWQIATFSGAIGFEHIFSPTFYSETIASQQWFSQYDVATGDPNLDYEQMLGTPNNFGETGFPQISGGIMTVTGTQFNYKGVQLVSNLDENLTKIMAKHELKFGGRYRHERFGYLPDRSTDQVGFSALATGLYNMASGSTPGATANTGYGEGDEFLGAANNYSVQLNPAYQHYWDQEFDAYVQDNFHVSRNLTVNLGLRYEAHPAPFVSNNQLETFDLKNKAMVLGQPTSWYVSQGYTTQTIINNLTNLGMVFETPQQAGLSSKMLRDNDLTFGPRVGAAYSLFGGRHGTVLRGAYGRYIFPVPVRNSLRLNSLNAPFETSYTQNFNSAAQSPDGTSNYMIRASNPVIAGVNSTGVVNSGNVTSIIPGLNEVTMNPDYAPNFVSEVNVTVEQALKGNSALRVSYVYTHASNLDQYYCYNAHPSNYVWTSATGTGSPTGTYGNTAQGPYDKTLYAGGCGTGSSQALDQTTGWSNYNALQVSYQRMFHHGLAYQINYVWSKNFRIGGNWARDSTVSPYADFAPGFGPAKPASLPSWGFSKELNRFENYKVDTGNPPHHIQFNGLYEMPVGKGKWLLGKSNRFVDELVGGYQIAGSGQVVGFNIAPSTSNWGPTNPLKVYKHSAPITDCRSGVCHPSYLWFNGYISPAALTPSEGGTCTGNTCVTGLPGNYVPYQTPIDNTPGTANFGSNGNNVTLPLTAGGTTQVGYNPGPGTNPFNKTTILGPMNYIAAASLFKVFPIKDGVKMRFQWDVFNLFNNQGYNAPNTTDGTESLQTAYWNNANGGGTGPRVSQFSLRLTF